MYRCFKYVFLQNVRAYIITLRDVNLLTRYDKNPIISRENIQSQLPELMDVTSVFNPGAVKIGNIYRLVLRVQNRGRETFLLAASSDNGINFDINDEPIFIDGLSSIKKKIYHIYDPRLTVINNIIYMMVAIDTDDGCCLGLTKTEDFNKYDFMGIVSENHIRNGVLFPEKINGKYMRLDRPNKSEHSGILSGNTICLSESENLLSWNKISELMQGHSHYWDELIGSGPPPVKTKKGWLHIYHGIATHFMAANIYQAGVVLLDLNDPSKVKARSRYNILEPREQYELTGQVPNVVFPSGMIVEEYDEDNFALMSSKVLIYYGAADTSVCLAISTIKELIEACYKDEEKYEK